MNRRDHHQAVDAMLEVTRRVVAALTPRELEIVGMLGRGLTAKEIAGALGISIWTVRHHLERARTRTGAMTTAHLLARVARPREEPRTT